MGWHTRRESEQNSLDIFLVENSAEYNYTVRVCVKMSENLGLKLVTRAWSKIFFTKPSIAHDAWVYLFL